MYGNSKAFMTKTLPEEIMQRTKLRSSFLKNPNNNKKKPVTKSRRKKDAIFHEP